MASLLLLLQSERTFNAADFLRETLVNLQALLNGVATVDNRRMIAVANQLTNTSSRHLCVFLCQIHRNLTHLHIVASTALAEDMLLGDVIVLANLLKDIVDGERMVVDLHGTLDNALSQIHVNIRIVDNRIGHQRVHHTFQVAYAAIDGLSNILNDIGRNLQTIATTLGIQDIDAELYRRLLQLSDETTGEACQHTLVQPLQIDRRTVAGKNNLLANA